MVKINLSELKKQKNRFFKKPKKPFLKFGEFGLVTLLEGRIEFVHLTFLKKYMKHFITKKKNKADVIREKI